MKRHHIAYLKALESGAWVGGLIHGNTARYLKAQGLIETRWRDGVLSACRITDKGRAVVSMSETWKMKEWAF